MKLIITEGQLLTLKESLKTYSSDIMEKIFRNFFLKKGFNEKKEFFGEVEKPNFMIVTDEKMMVNSKYKDSMEFFKYCDISIFFTITDHNIKDDVIRLLESGGYFVANDRSEGDFGYLFIEPKYDDINFDGEFLYHVTPEDNVRKILTIGLKPRTRNTRSNYPARIHLSPNLKWNDSIKRELEHDTNEKYVTLQINRGNLKLHRDLRFKGGFFTYDNISPNDITILKSEVY